MEGSDLTPQRANAAQMAQRNIKAKPKARAGIKPTRPNVGLGMPGVRAKDESVPLFAPMPAGDAPSFGGNTNPFGGSFGAPKPTTMFGGSVQGSGAFSFQAPSGPSFPLSQDATATTNPFSTDQSSFTHGLDRDSERLTDTRSAKRQFMGAEQPPIFTNSTPAAQIQGQTHFPNVFATSKPAPSPALSFAPNTQSPAAFTPTPKQDQPFGNSFSFGGPPKTSTPAFGAGANATAFPSTTPAQPPLSPFTFGQTNTSQPAVNSNAGATTGTSQPGNIFSSLLAPKTSQAPNMFEAVQQPSTTGPSSAPASNIFANQSTLFPPVNNQAQSQDQSPTKPAFSNVFNNSQASTAPNPFAGLTSQAQTQDLNSSTPVFTSSVFKSTQASTAPNPFGIATSQAQTQEQSPAKPVFSNNLFHNAQASSLPNPFEAATSQAQTQEQSPAKPVFSNNLFNTQAPLPPNMFGTAGSQSQTQEQSPTKPSSSIFNTMQPSPSSNMFGQPNGQPQKQDQSPTKPATNAAPTGSIFNNATTTSQSFTGFGQAAPAQPQPSVQPESASTQSSAFSNAFSNTQSTAKSSTEPLGMLNQPLDKPTPKANGVLASSNGNTNKPSGNLFSMAKPSTSSNNAGSSSSHVPPKQNAPSTVAPKAPSGRSSLWNNAPYSTPKPYTPAISSRLAHVENAEGPSIEKDADAPEEPARPPSFLNSSGENTFVNHEGNPEDYPELFPGMAYASRYPIEKMAGFVPTHFTPEQRIEFYTGYRMRALNKAMQRYFGTVQISDNIFPAMRYYNSLREVIVQRTSEDLTQELGKLKHKEIEGRDTHAEPSSKRQKPVEAASLFQRPSSKSGPSQSLSNGEKAAIPPTPQPSQKLLPPSNPLPTASPSKGKRKGDDLTKRDWEESGSSTPLKRAKMQSANESIGSGSSTSTLFKNALKGPVRGLPKQSTEENNEQPKANPFAILPASASTTPTTSPSRPAASASTFGSFTPKIDGPPSVAPQPTFGGFTPKAQAPVSTLTGASTAIEPPIFASAPATGFTPKPSGIAPPKFGTGPTNFLAQFSANAEATEKKEMQKAKDEDMDSDEDEAEWEANWKKKRAARKKELDDLAKSNKPTFVPGKGFSLGEIKKTSDNASSEKVNESSVEGSKSLFGQNPAPKSSGTSVFSSVNGSRTPTPGPFSGTGGSVLDTHKSGQPVTFGGNIFGHLSDADSGASGKNSAADEDSDDGTEGESDSENKDPSFKPGKENQSRQSTPAEETGAGIASAKKTQATPFPFLGSTPKSSGLFAGMSKPTSGTSTPSLFDRINRDADGNPIRELSNSSEEKENTQPSSTNVFGEAKNSFASLNKPAGLSSDHTWKQDSPIKFGTATPASDSKAAAPAVTVQAATPTKPSPSFGNLFGTTNDPKSSSAAPQMSNLFSGLKGSSTGFGFGATSSSSSLFPSAAASVTTSRASTPGATSDGDSVAEGDPDGVKHEQIDLTAGGRGEENENILHQVRARALQFNADESKWDVKGLGPLKILKDKDTNAVRILLRADPSGKIILNKAVLSQTYQATQKTVKLLTAADSGSDLESWILQVKTAELAESLATVLEDNKP